MVLAPESKTRGLGSGVVFTYIELLVGGFMRGYTYVERKKGVWRLTSLLNSFLLSHLPWFDRFLGANYFFCRLTYIEKQSE